jgi:hypothetical protein
MLGLRRGRVVGVDELIDALWGEELPADGVRRRSRRHTADEREERMLQMTSSLLVSTLVSMGAGLWMVRAAIAKRLLAWRKIDRNQRSRR